MPATTYSTGPEPESAATRLFLRLLERLGSGRLDLITPGGSVRTFDSGEPGPRALLRLTDWGVLDDVLRRGDIGFAEAFMERRWDTPDLAELLALAAVNYDRLQRVIHGRWWGWIVYRLRHLFRDNRRAQARRNISAHYDLGNDFYSLWLDDSMTYSSALFEQDEKRTLEQAQAAKMERICATLDIQEGDRILEIGCGWGGFAEHAVRTRRCRIEGITLSREQLDFARQRIERAGLSDVAQFHLRDYRDVRGEYDGVVSIEMFEAVGERYWPAYFETVRRSLRKGGRAIIQTIVIADDLFDRYRRGTDFIQQYIFPGGMLPSRSVFRDHAVRQGLVIGETFAFRLDYAETLKRWRLRFNRRGGELNASGFDERFMRLWNFYLAYCEAGFRAGTIDVVQVELKRVI